MLTLPKPYISVSQVQLWQADPIAYQKKYFIGIPDKPSPFMDFGKQFAKDIEDYAAGIDRAYNFPDNFLQTTKIYKYVEYELKHDFGEFEYLGYIDNMDEDRQIVVDFKTGTAPWTQARLEESLQMQLYSNIIYQQFQQLPTCFINYWQTRLKGKEVLWTGVNEIYRHTFSFQDLAKAEAQVRMAARQISEAYDQYKNDEIKGLFAQYSQLVQAEKAAAERKDAIRTQITSLLNDSKLALSIDKKLITYTTYQKKSYLFTDKVTQLQDNIDAVKKQEISTGIAKEEHKTITLINVKDEGVE